MKLWRERALVFTNDRSDFWNHFIKQIMHIRRSVVSNIIHPRFSALCVSDFYKVTSGWIILTNDLSNVHYLYTAIIVISSFVQAVMPSSLYNAIRYKFYKALWVLRSLNSEKLYSVEFICILPDKKIYKWSGLWRYPILSLFPYFAPKLKSLCHYRQAKASLRQWFAWFCIYSGIYPSCLVTVVASTKWYKGIVHVCREE